jgi:CHAT domain-containing protein
MYSCKTFLVCCPLLALNATTSVLAQGLLESDACHTELADGRLSAGQRAYAQAWEHSNSQRNRDALSCFRVSLAIRIGNLGAFDKLTVDSIIGVAMSLNGLGRSWDAEELLKSRLALEPPSHSNWKGYVDLLHYLGYIFGGQKRTHDEENAYLEALKIARQFTGSEHLATTQSLDHLADFYSVRDPARFQSLMLESLAIQERHDVPNSNQYIHRLMALATSYESSNKSLAEATLLKALHFVEQRLSEKDRDLSQIHMALSSHYNVRNMTDKAIHHAREEIRVVEIAEGPDSANVANGLARLSQLLSRNRQFAEAAKLERRACTVTAANFHYAPVISGCWSNLADILADARESQEAYEVITMAASQLRAHELVALRANNGDAKELRRYFSGSPFAYTFLSQIHKGWRIFQDTSDDHLKLRIIGESFEAAQWAMRSRAADALNRTTARLSAISPELSDLARRIETLTPAKEAAETALITEYNKADSTTERIDILRADLAHRQQEVDALTLEMIRQFPAYATLSNPAPLSVDAARSLLEPDEVLVQFLVMDRRDTGTLSRDTFAWFISRDETRWTNIRVGAEVLVRKVAMLRCGLDPSAWVRDKATGRWYAAEPSCRELEPIRNAASELPFDTNLAHVLYLELFGQAADLVAGKHLLIVPSGSLASLPFHALVTRQSKLNFGDDALTSMRELAWLVRTSAITVLPSIASLAGLRKQERGTSAIEAFIGWGDPVLVGVPGCPGTTFPDACADGTALSRDASARSLVGVAGHALQSPAGLFRGGIADVAKVRALCPLPDTALELKCVAKSLGPSSAIRLGSDATETALKLASLDRYRIVHFATHGLLAADVQQLASIGAEPALVLTPPAIATDVDDGLLTASEIAALKLNADWVILSACNTSAGNSPGDEALSGLARAFFYAGARALLVSHWAVDTTATVKLITRALAMFSEGQAMGRAEAMRRSMIELMNDADPLAAHPTYWAPFVVVGEGGAR